jgi:hypothetical protein
MEACYDTSNEYKDQLPTYKYIDMNIDVFVWVHICMCVCVCARACTRPWKGISVTKCVRLLTARHLAQIRCVSLWQDRLVTGAQGIRYWLSYERHSLHLRTGTFWCPYFSDSSSTQTDDTTWSGAQAELGAKMTHILTITWPWSTYLVITINLPLWRRQQ